ncbi:MAG: radical SAM protein [Phycisphaerales bacterium]|nr:MAG: radical SAM protein [Phycisphaerales bacterium]
MINISKLYCGLAGRSDDLRYGPSAARAPVAVYNCVAACNLRCVHCYSSSDAGRRYPLLNTDQSKKLLAQLADADCPVVLFSGGEPLLRPDLFELLVEAKRIGLRTVISTNGTLIDLATARKLAELDLAYVGISIDGPEDFHDRFRQSDGCFKAALAGFQNCRDAGLRTGLRFTITKQNAPHVPAVFDVAAEAGIRRLCWYHLVRSGRASDMAGLTVTSEQTRQVLDVILDRTDEFVKRDLVDEVLTVGNHADGPYLLLRMQKENRPGLDEARRLLLARGGNKVGEKIASVGWDGSVYADQFWRNYCLGNITDRPFKKIWADTSNPVLARLRDKSTFADPRCLKCRFFDLCRGNYRFLGSNPADDNWLNEPPCYLADEEIGIT